MRRLVCVLLIALPGFVPVMTIAARAEAATASALPPDATILLPGHGWGHGRAMGQSGANGMARNGTTYRSILSHFYSGVTFAARPSNETIRVLVEASPDVVVTSDQPFHVSWPSGTAIATSDATYKFWRARYDGSVYRVERATAWNGPWLAVASGSSYVVFTPGASMLNVVFGTGSVRIYRGKIIGRYSSVDGMRTMNELPLEWYLYGSVPRESPSSWPAEELKSQAVAARTYASYKKDSARANGTMYDICATTSCQVYMGYGSRAHPGTTVTVLEARSSNDAVDATSGQVLLYNNKPILAEYSSSTGGYTAPGTVAYQKAVPDTGDAVSPHHDWAGAVRVSEVQAHWPQLGKLVGINVTGRNGYGEWGGRVQKIELVGTGATVSLSGGSFVSAYEWPARTKGLQSTWFDVRYWAGELVSAPSTLSMLAGATTTIPVQVRNTGNQDWPVGGPIRITAAAGSPFAAASWVSPTRPASVKHNITTPSKSTVSRGEIAEFSVPISASGVAPGDYTQKFGTIADGTSSMTPAFTLAVQVLPSWTEEAPNLLANPSFEYSTGAWSSHGFTTADVPTRSDPRDGESSLHLAGGSKSLSQTIVLAGGLARHFVLAGWSRTSGTSPNAGAIELDAVMKYADGTTQTERVPFGRGAHPWSFGETAFAASGTLEIASITVTALIANQTGDVWFDALRLLESTVTNPSFEQEMSSWGATGFGSGDGVVNTAARDGAHALALASTGAESATQVIALAGRRSERFVASIWSRGVGTDANGGAEQLTITFRTANGGTSANVLELPKAEHAWTLSESSIVAPADFTSASVSIARSAQTGTLYLDEVRLVRTWTQNPSFESALAPWTAVGTNVVLGLPARDGVAAARLTGDGVHGVKQRIALVGGIGKRLVLYGWSRAIGSDQRAGFIGVRLVFHNTDGSLSTVSVPFSRAPHQWAYSEQRIAAPKAFSSVDLVALIEHQTGTTSFDGLRIRSV